MLTSAAVVPDLFVGAPERGDSGAAGRGLFVGDASCLDIVADKPAPLPPLLPPVPALPAGAAAGAITRSLRDARRGGPFPGPAVLAELGRGDVGGAGCFSEV